MGNIVLLDELTINKIAAGEVIERPASVIKEMVENSIDAGATNITVEIKNGGISYIRVIDNGKGIAADDLEMAFERHATSKIRSADDLNRVTSMGFRGEALASIAAVSHVELVSKTQDQQVGYKVVVEGGNVLNKEEAGCSTGTIITVQNLFYNTPVRYKFLKKDYTESGYIEDVITQTALIHPEIAIKLINTGKTVIQTTGNGDIKSVIYSIYGKDVAEATIPTDYKYEDITIKGVVGKPEIARSNRSRQIFFVNKRYIKDKTLSAAVAEAFKGMIPIGKFGFVILDIEMDPSKVDVNVHPAKLEVRFEDEKTVFKAIYHTIKDALLKSELVENTSKEHEKKEEAFVAPDPVIIEPHEEKAGGLFGWRKNKKQEEKDINEPEENENIISQIYNKKHDENAQGDNTGNAKTFETSNAESNPKEEAATGEPIDTFEILEQLKGLQEKIKTETEEIKKGNTSFLNNTENVEKSGDEINANVNATNTNEASVNVANTENSENGVTASTEKATNQTDNPETAEISEANAEVKEETTNYNLEKPQTSPQDIIANDENLKEEAQEVKTKIDKILDNGNTQELPDDFTEMYLKTFGIMPKTEEQKKESTKEEVASALDVISDDSNMSIFESVEKNKRPPYRFIGIAFKTFIILEMNKELYIIDQHAAHERIMYEKVKKNYYSDEEKNSQLLLLPDVITLTHKEMDIAKENIPMFEKAGFVLEEFGENTIKLSGVPDICVDLNTKELFLETLDEINTVARTAKQEKEEKFIATVACKAAVKANMALTEEEVNSLMDELLQLPNPFTCPHGRPTAIKMTKYDLERKFARK